MIVLACTFRTDEGECILENKPCDGCKDAPYFIDWENDFYQEMDKHIGGGDGERES